MERETYDLEYKRDKTKSFLKTVPAFANWQGGWIVFGVSDDDKVTGLSNLTVFCLDIEDMINDNAEPVPEFRLSEDETRRTVTLYADEGLDMPYCYKGKAYKRSDSASVPVSRLEYARLVLQGQNRSYDSLGALRTDLTFHKLEEELRKAAGIEQFGNHRKSHPGRCPGPFSL